MARALTSVRSAETGGKAARLNDSAKPGIARHQIATLCRELAANEVQRSELAKKYGVTRSAITQFAQRHAARIEQIAGHLDDEFASLWVASKFQRLAFYQAELEATEGNTHHEWVKARTAILRAVAEELGALPPRSQLVVAPVVHILENVIMEDLT